MSSKASSKRPASPSEDSEAKKSKVLEYSEKKGDLFSCTADTSLAHCISEDCVMGKGVATLFKKKFGGVSDLKDQVSKGKKTGSAAVLKREMRFVYYLMTKQKYSNKPTYESLRNSLVDMKKHCEAHGVTQLAMPKIGCGLDGLHWNKVSQMIREVFEDVNITIVVYYL